MNKSEYIDFVRNSLPGVDKTARFHPRQVEMALNEAVNTVFYEVYKANPKAFKKSMERYTTVVRGTCTSTTWSDRYETLLTVDVVDLPTKAGGIYEVLSVLSLGNTNDTTKFIPVTTMEGEQFYGSEASLPGDVIGFAYSRSRTIEYWDMDATTASQGVDIRLIKQFKSYSSTDEVLLPYGQNARILELVREYLGVIPPKDIINNNTNNG